jgi:membrane protease YdiL (CAAX protease family)
MQNHDAVLIWRQDWAGTPSQGTAAEDVPCTPQHRLRGHYGTYRAVVVDVMLSFVAQFVCLVPLLLIARLLFVPTGHHPGPGPVGSAAFGHWLATTPFVILLALAVTDTSLLAVLWRRVRSERMPWRMLGLGSTLRVDAGRALLWGIGIGVVALVINVMVTVQMQRWGVDEQVQRRELIDPLVHAPLWVALSTAAWATMVSPVVEELFFRGYIFRALAVRKGVLLAYVISAGAFAVVHGLPTLFPALFVLGLFFAFSYRHSGNLLASMTAHALNNGVVYGLALLPPYIHMVHH